MSYRIKRLEPSELVLMAGLLDCFGSAFDDPVTYAAARPDAVYTRQLLESDSFIALVALQNGRVIGGLAAYELKKFEQPRSEVYIYDLAVTAGHRRRGVATALIEHLKPIARARGAWVIYVQADQGDEPAMALYRTLGVEESVLHFDIPMT